MQETAVAVDAPTPPPLPKIKTMRVGDKTLAGDAGFDPLELADTPEALAWYREAEVKHARLAMLAAFGWPISEVTNFGQLLTGDGRAPWLLLPSTGSRRASTSSSARRTTTCRACSTSTRLAPTRRRCARLRSRTAALRCSRSPSSRLRRPSPRPRSSRSAFSTRSATAVSRGLAWAERCSMSGWSGGSRNDRVWRSVYGDSHGRLGDFRRGRVWRRLYRERMNPFFFK